MASASTEAIAHDYEQQAEQALAKFRIFNRSAKYDEAAELYSKAAAQYKIAKLFQEAGDCYVKAGQNASQSENPYEAINHYTNAAKCFKLAGSKADAIRVYEMVVAKQQENNKFSVAAKLYKEIAELEEADLKLGNAIEAYQKAADCFAADDANTSANQMLIKVADLSASEEDYKRAIQLYEQVATASMDNNLTKWSVPDYFFKALLCTLALSAKQGNDRGQLVRDASDRYKEMYAAFETSRECQFIDKLLPFYEERDVDGFTDTVADFDQLFKLDKWKSSLLLLAKNGIAGPADHEPDLS